MRYFYHFDFIEQSSKSLPEFTQEVMVLRFVLGSCDTGVLSASSSSNKDLLPTLHSCHTFLMQVIVPNVYLQVDEDKK